MTQNWLNISATISPAQLSQLEDALFAAGAVSLEFRDAADQPILEPDPDSMPVWDQTTVTGLFPAEVDVANTISRLAAETELELSQFSSSDLPEQDWTELWRSHFRPQNIGERLWIGAQEDLASCAAERAAVIISPGLAFGSGSHPTTKLCLEWLAATDLADKTVIDYGCGSGILAIAALKLGAAKVWAVDHDPQALEATWRNARLNDCEQQLELALPQDESPFRAEVLVANILAGPLVELAPAFAELTQPAARLALSGILAEQQTLIADAYAPYFSSLQCQQEGDWLCLSGHRQAVS